MRCPHCDQELEQIASFCPFCGGTTPQPASPEEEPVKVIQRLYPPETAPAPEPIIESEPAPSSPPEPSPVISQNASTAPSAPTVKKAKREPKGTSRSLRICTTIAVIIAILCGISTAYVLTSTHGLRVELTKAQTERASAEAAVTNLGSQISQLEESLASVKEERDQLSAQVTDLTAEVNSMESSVNQSAYDKEAAQRELLEAQEDVKALSGEITEVRNQLTTTESALQDEKDAKEKLQSDYDTLKDAQKEMEDELSFYDSYVVFVMLGSSSKYYHKYDCEDFTQRSFLAYSTKLAEANGYSPCPKCCG